MNMRLTESQKLYNEKILDRKGKYIQVYTQNEYNNPFPIHTYPELCKIVDINLNSDNTPKNYIMRCPYDEKKILEFRAFDKMCNFQTEKGDIVQKNCVSIREKRKYAPKDIEFKAVEEYSIGKSDYRHSLDVGASFDFYNRYNYDDEESEGIVAIEQRELVEDHFKNSRKFRKEILDTAFNSGDFKGWIIKDNTFTPPKFDKLLKKWAETDQIWNKFEIDSAKVVEPDAWGDFAFRYYIKMPESYKN